MTRLWDSFSILLVLAMLLFLLPAAVLLGPTATVVLADTDSRTTNTTMEMMGDFVITTNASNPLNNSGTWAAFNVGNGSFPDQMEQFTREGVTVNGTWVNNSGFRNYSLYNGTISGNLTGALSMRFNMWCFNMTYPSTPKYGTYPCFGFMFGRGQFNTTSGNIPFTFICDLDGNQNFTNATGKGVMSSYNETGIYSGRQIMGSFTMNISNTSYYSGTFNLRNYPIEEIFPEGWTNLSSGGTGAGSGAIKKDNSDDVADNCSLTWFDLARGDYHLENVTGVDDNAGLEAAYPGEEGSQTVRVSSMGAGGLVNNSRNSFLHMGSTGLAGRGTGVVCFRSYINDTYDCTGADSSTHGWLYQVYLMDFPYIQTGFGGGWIYLYGYTMNNFNQWNQSTEDYAGIETNGVIRTAFNAALTPPYNTYSNITAWDLRPTPKVLSCTPSSGTQGTTMNVTLGGRYFLRHSSLCPFSNRSRISFGPDITVNYWVVANASPIDNAITVNITIGAGAAPGARDVEVTAWFGNYSNSSTWSNNTGALVNGFTVTRVNYTLTMAVTGNGTTTPAVGNHSYVNGTVVDLTATPDPYWDFVSWTGDVADPDSPSTTVTIDGNKTVTANFAISRHNLTISSTNGGNVTVPGEGNFTYDYGTIVSLTATSNTGYRFVNWTGDVGTIANTTSASTTIAMMGDYSIVANFVKTYNLTISSTSGGNVTTPGEGNFTYDDSAVVNLVATPDTGYHFVNWTGDVTTITDVNSASTNITMNGDYSITANFAINTYSLTISSTAGGSVTTPGEGTFGPYTHGTVINITATANTGYHFVGWTGNVSTIANVSSASTTITMNGDYSITANFAINTYSLTISSTAGGNVTIPGEGTYGPYVHGTAVGLKAVADAGYRFVNWTGDVDTVTDVNSAVTTIAMMGDYSIIANFVKTYNLTISSTSGGNVSIPGEGIFNYANGTVVNLVATPDTGYHFVNWTGDVTTIADVNSASTNIAMMGDYSIVANFEKTLPQISFSPESLSFGAREGGSNPENQTLEIWNSGEWTLNWTANTSAVWLNVYPTNGSSTGEHDNVTVSVNVTGLTIGYYNTTITVTDPEAGNSPQAVPVSLLIASPGEFLLTVAKTGNGTVNPSPGVHNYSNGTNVTLTAYPGSGWGFVNWSLSNVTPAVLTHTYNYVNVTSPSDGPHWAWYTDVDDMAWSPYQAVGGSLNTKTEATTARYEAINSSNDVRWTTPNPGGGDEVFLLCNMSINEPPATITSINFTFEGYSSTTGNHQIYAYNRTLDGNWAAGHTVGAAESITTGADKTFTRTLSGVNFSNYVNASGLLTWGVLGPAGGLGGYPMSIDYVEVVVSYNGTVGSGWTTTDNHTYVIMNLDTNATANFKPFTTANITGTVYEANASVVSGATIVLKCGNSTVASTTSNATGYYNFTVNTTCNYTVNVTKSGLFSPVQKWANIITLGSNVNCDFKGMDALYRTAPNSKYCIKCSNLWLYGSWYPEGFALNAQRVSDVLYAWTHPS